MTHNDEAPATDAIKAALVQGLRAFMASEAMSNASDTRIERAAGNEQANPTAWDYSRGQPARGC